MRLLSLLLITMIAVITTSADARAKIRIFYMNQPEYDSAILIEDNSGFVLLEDGTRVLMEI